MGRAAAWLRRGVEWARRRGYWPPTFYLMGPGDKGEAEKRIEEHLGSDDGFGPKDRHGPG